MRKTPVTSKEGKPPSSRKGGSRSSSKKRLSNPKPTCLYLQRKKTLRLPGPGPGRDTCHFAGSSSQQPQRKKTGWGRGDVKGKREFAGDTSGKNGESRRGGKEQAFRFVDSEKRIKRLAGSDVAQRNLQEKRSRFPRPEARAGEEGRFALIGERRDGPTTLISAIGGLHLLKKENTFQSAEKRRARLRWP